MGTKQHIIEPAFVYRNALNEYKLTLVKFINRFDLPVIFNYFIM